MQKTHQSAVVLIPPREVWAPIQAIRREHDRHLRRWMPHVTLQPGESVSFTRSIEVTADE